MVEQTNSPPGTLNSPPCTMEEEDQITDDMKGDYMKGASMDGIQTPVVSAPERIELAAELDGNLTPEGGTEIDPNKSFGSLPGRLLFPSEVPVFPNAIHQSWLNGQTTLQLAGQCIGAELEVAMLCMQKRLGKVNRLYLVHQVCMQGGTCCITSKCRPFITSAYDCEST